METKTDGEINELFKLNVVAGGSHAENMHHGIARRAFIPLLMNTQRCKDLFNEMSQVAEISEHITRAGAAMDAYDAYSSIHGANQDLVRALRFTADRERQRFNDALHHFDTAPVIRLISRYVITELQLPWVWLIWEILTAWTYTVVAEAGRDHIRVHHYYHYKKPEAPTFAHELRVQENESHDAAIERLGREAKEIIDGIKHHKEANTLPKGYRRPAEKVQQCTEWYFRHNVLGEPKRHIARHTMDGTKLAKGFEYERKAIQNGIKDAESWLNNTPYRIDMAAAQEELDLGKIAPA